jgi:hypothetical protein
MKRFLSMLLNRKPIIIKNSSVRSAFEFAGETNWGCGKESC